MMKKRRKNWHRLFQEFELLKELGRLKYFLRIKVAYSNQGIFISQQNYITDLLAKTGKIGCIPVSTPMDPNNKLCKAEKKSAIDKKMHPRLIRKLIYFAHTWPNITLSMSVVSQVPLSLCMNEGISSSSCL